MRAAACTSHLANLAHTSVIGQWDSFTYSAHTLGFSLPPVTKEKHHTAVFGKYAAASRQWLLCRSSDCDGCVRLHDSYLYHIDCFHVIGRNATLKKPSLHDLWTVATWTESLPKTRYQAPPDIGAGIAPDKAPIEGGSVFALTCDLPQELRDVIVWLCPESPAWRYASALNRWRIFQPLLDPDIETKELFFDDIKYWCRNRGLVAGKGGSGKIIIKLDDLGISQMNYANDPPPPSTAVSRSQIVWYVVEEVSTMRMARIEVKVRQDLLHTRKDMSVN